MRHLIIILSIFATLNIFGQQSFPAADYQDQKDPLASEDAIPGGSIRFFLGQEPSSINYYLDNFSSSYAVFSLMFESLLRNNSLTLDFEPNLASKWTISKDKLTFTFHIDPAAKWSDGKAVTAGDVKWTFEEMKKNPHVIGSLKVDLNRFTKTEIINDREIRFTAAEVHWKNLDALGGLMVMPSHLFNKDYGFEKMNSSFPVTSGPYKIKERKPGHSIVLSKNKEWWQAAYKRNQFKYNFDELVFRFFGDRKNALDSFKKDEIDVHAVYTSKYWIEETKGKGFEKNWMIKQRIYNDSPIFFQGWAMNMRREPFNDKNVRKAVWHLLDRKKMNRLLMYKQYSMHKSYYEDLYSEKHPNTNEYIEFDVDKARKLLQTAGWHVNAQTGKLEKDGKVFTINFLTRSPSTKRFMSIFREDLKKVGIELNVQQKDLAAWKKDMEKFDFDMTWAAWGGSTKKDPEPIWLSKEADRPHGNNYPGLKSQKVDELIKEQRSIFDINKRHEIARTIDKMVYSEYPYALLWYNNHTRLLYWNRFGMPDWVLSRYGEEYDILQYWWADPDAEIDLKESRENDESLPKPESNIYFHKRYRP